MMLKNNKIHKDNIDGQHKKKDTLKKILIICSCKNKFYLYLNYTKSNSIHTLNCEWCNNIITNIKKIDTKLKKIQKYKDTICDVW